MRRKNQGSRIAKKCIVWAMVAMMAVGSMAPAQTVYAVDQIQQSQDHVADGAPDSNNPVYNDNEADKNAASQKSVEDMQNQVEKAQAAAADAAAAVDTAKQAVDAATAKVGASKVKDTNGTVTTPASGAEGAADTAKEDAAAAGSAADTAKTTVDALNADTAAEVKNYNDKVAADQTAADTKAPVATVEVKDAAGNTTTAPVDEYAADQAAIAKQKADDAQKALETALAVDTTDAKNQDVQENVQKAKDAAADAKSAAAAAQTAAKTAAASLLQSIKEYNAYAFAYGLPAYASEDGTTYTIKDAKGNVVTPGYSAEGMAECNVTAQDPTKDEVQKDIDAINQADITAQKSAIDAAKTSVDHAVDAQTEAQKAAEAADAAVKEMNAKLGDGTTAGDVKTAADAADTVNNYHVDPAQAAYDASAAVAQSKQSDLDTAKQAAQQAADNLTDKSSKQAAAAAQAKDAGEAAYNTQLNALDNALTAAKSVTVNIEDYYWFTSIFGVRNYHLFEYWGALEDASSGVDKAQNAKDNFVNNHNSYVSNYVANDQNVINASKAVDEASRAKNAADAAVNDKQQALDQANTQAASDQAVLTAAQTVRDNYIKEATEAYKNNTINTLETEINKALKGYSDKVNQVQYDQDSNTWANDDLTWNIGRDIRCAIPKAQIRYCIDHSSEYGNGNDSFKDLLRNAVNLLPVGQYIVTTKEKNAIMDAIIASTEQTMTEYNEKMKTVQVNAANLATKDSLTAAQATAQAEQANLTQIAEINTKVTAAQTDLKSAQSTYQTASDKLAALKASVKDAKLNSIDLTKLQAAIAAAQKKVDAAKDSLKEAKAAAASAENYKNWAVALVTEHVTKSFGQAAINADGKTVDKNGNVTTKKDQFVTATENAQNYDEKEVISRPSSKFTYNLNTVTVPYSIYRAYVEKMYKISNYNQVANKNQMRGQGVMTTDTMPVVYWAVDENGKLTGTNYLSTDNTMPTGTYFVGYTFKHESDGYHIDGTQVIYTKPVEPTPEPTPAPADNNTDNGTNVTVNNAATPAVLGVNRAAATDEGAVLGAKRAADNAENGQAVLGANRAVQTGDASNAFGWALLMTVAGAGAAFVLVCRRKEMKNNEQNQ